MQGKIVKGIAGFYYVDVVESGIYECKAKGIFRKDKQKPLVGDNVIIDIIDEEAKKGNVVGILDRNNELIRPAVANVDQAMVVFSITQPKPHFNLLDRFLVMMECKQIPVILCFNKKDIGKDKELQMLREIYDGSNYKIMFTSAAKEGGIANVRQELTGKTTVVAGPSGVGKSSIINILQPKACMETAGISKKIERGKHTTRHSELITIDKATYIVDTPGFSSLYTNDFEKEELRHYFPEFVQYEGTCRFQGCNHINEPQCSVKKAVEEGKIHGIRYKNYVEMYDQLKDKRRY